MCNASRRLNYAGLIQSWLHLCSASISCLPSTHEHSYWISLPLLIIKAEIIQESKAFRSLRKNLKLDSISVKKAI